MTRVGCFCQDCIYYHKELFEGWNVACDAFPNGIPGKYSLAENIGDLKNCKEGYGYIEKKGE